MNTINTAGQNFPAFVTTIRHQLGLSQEDLARQLGVSFATVNRWEKGHCIPSKLAQAQFNVFNDKMHRCGRLGPPEGPRP